MSPHSGWKLIPKLQYRFQALKDTAEDNVLCVAVACIVIFLIPIFYRECVLYFLSVISVSIVVAPFVRQWKPKRKLKAEGKAVFITGCTSGFRYLTALALDKEGFRVFAGCRSPNSQQACELKNAASSRLTIVPVDVISDESVKKAADYVMSNLGQEELWAVINNAGVFCAKDVMWAKMQDLRDVLEVNVFGVVRVTKAFLPHLCKSRKGRIVNINSLAGNTSTPGCVLYCMSKYASRAFGEGLRQELYDFKVKVVNIYPGVYETRMADINSVESSIIKAWDEVPDDIKELYRPYDAEAFATQISSFIRCFKSDRVHEVTDCIKEAVMNENPYCSYYPGKLRDIIYNTFLLSVSPAIKDFALSPLRPK